jgi:hypothetical protein
MRLQSMPCVELLDAVGTPYGRMPSLRGVRRRNTPVFNGVYRVTVLGRFERDEMWLGWVKLEEKDMRG